MYGSSVVAAGCVKVLCDPASVTVSGGGARLLPRVTGSSSRLPPHFSSDHLRHRGHAVTLLRHARSCEDN